MNGLEVGNNMADGTIVIDTELKTDKLRNKLDKLNNDIERQRTKVHDLQLEYDRLNDALTDAKARGAYINPDDVAATDQARLNLERAQIALEGMEVGAANTEAQLATMNTSTASAGANLNAAKAAIDKFTKRLITMAKKVFIFTMITKTLRGIRSYMQRALETNEAYQKSVAKLKGTMMTAFQPILEFVIPILQAFVNILTRAFALIAKFTSWLGGTTVGASSDAAKALYDQANAAEAAGSAAEKAKRQMSGLDEMNTWQSDSSGGGAGGGGGAKAPDFSSSIEGPMSELEVYISGALLALGAILTFTGVSIPIGLALMALGAAGLVSALAVDWNAMPDGVKKALTTTLLVLGGAALVIGAILTFTGANIPLGIGLMIAGAAGLGTAAALNWDTIVKKIRGPFGKILAIISASLIVIGMLLLMTGAALPLGIGLILAGAVGLASTVAINWNAIVDKLKTVWSNITNWFNSKVKPKLTKAYWQAKFDVIKTALADKIKGGINAAIALFNRFVSWVNDKMHITWKGVSVAGKQVIPSGNIQLLHLNNIPMLAKGGVIPANHAFLSILGDQKQGTNIEAPEDLIRKIVREEAGAGTYTFVAQLNGKTVFEEVISQAKMKQRMTGKNAFKLGAV